ncbi:hypothetical protein SCHPADRAFT_910683 [Schizopora paradoxa]|uniref:Uncharacterized protein n=1 Tax=Schizopora paradoxa TaxID=27342 RepID=A0A0H2R918_9AGAM|nr:hypothetical protein SCHPADRAFT_910683 [Schizopora paradoxa]
MSFLFRRHALPLRWLRLPLIIFTLGMSGVCIAVCAQAISGTKNLEMQLATIANADSVQDFRFDMQDVRSTTDVLLAVACMVALTGFVCAALLIWDWVTLLFAPGIQNGPSSQRISTRTLRLQAAVYGFLSIWLFAILIPSTFIVRRRHAKVMDSSNNLTMLPANLMNVDTRYWDYGFLRCLGAAPWFTLIATLPTTLVTICAAHLLPVQREDEAIATKEKSLE